MDIRVVCSTLTVTTYIATLTSLLKKKKTKHRHHCEHTFLKEEFLGPVIHTIKVFIFNANYPLMRFTPFYLSIASVRATVAPHCFQ